MLSGYNGISIAAILLFGILLSGCVSEMPGAGNASTTQQIGGYTGFEKNKTVISNNVSFKVIEWGFSKNWELDSPPTGAKYLWVLISAKNIGPVPKRLSNDFKVSYRGTNVTMPGTFIFSSKTQLIFYECSSCTTYPDIEKAGFLLFEVPSGLKDDEAIFYANLGADDIFAMKLSDPYQYDGSKHVTLSNATLNCTVEGCGLITVLFINDDPIPLKETLWVKNATINGRSWKPQYTAVSYSFIPPWGYILYYSDPKITYRKNESRYYLSKSEFNQNTSLGGPGDEITVGFTVDYIDSNGAMKNEVQTIAVQLPAVD